MRRHLTQLLADLEHSPDSREKTAFFLTKALIWKKHMLMFYLIQLAAGGYASPRSEHEITSFDGHWCGVR